MRRCTEALPSPRTKLASSSIAPYRRRNGRPVARVAGGAGSYEATAALQTPGRSGPPAVRDRDAVFCVNAPHVALHTAWRLSVGCSMRQRAPRQPIERTLENESGSVLIDDFGAAGARHIRRDQLALDCGGGQPLVPKRDRKIGQPREIAGKGARRLRTRPFAAVHVDGQAENEGDRLSLGGQREQARCVGGKIPARDSLDGRREPPVGIACRHANRLAAEIKPDQGAASRQMRGRLGQGKDQCGHERGVARPRPADHLQAAAKGYAAALRCVCRPSAISSMILAEKASRSLGWREVITPWSTTTEESSE